VTSLRPHCPPITKRFTGLTRKTVGSAGGDRSGAGGVRCFPGAQLWSLVAYKLLMRLHREGLRTRLGTSGEASEYSAEMMQGRGVVCQLH
jgi:hypothetical protein